MRKCTDCLYYGVTEEHSDEMTCSKPTAQMTNIVCLLRRMLWGIYCIQESIESQTEILETTEDDEDTEDWKRPK